MLQKTRLFGDNGPSYIAGDLAEYIEARKMSHVRGAMMHPQIQGKIERGHQTSKSRILLENYFLLGDLEAVKVGGSTVIPFLSLKRLVQVKS